MIAPDLARLQTSLDKQNVQLVLLSYGDPGSNQKQANEHGLKYPILLPKDKDRQNPSSIKVRRSVPGGRNRPSSAAFGQRSRPGSGIGHPIIHSPDGKFRTAESAKSCTVSDPSRKVVSSAMA